jgi:RNA polymerase sigma-70 factor (ECF subfamily)
MVLTRSRADADDLAQATAERALQNAEKFEIGSDLDRWLFTMARRLWLNNMRANAVRVGQGVVPIEDSDLADEKPPVETNIFAREVLTKIDGLPDGQRLCVLLVYVEGYSYREASALLEVPIGTVMSRLATARKVIAGFVEDEG